MNRKSQVDKFEAKLAKKRQDEQVIKETEVRQGTLEKRAGKVANHYGVSTEDIFAIIARDSIGSFIKMWNNSMETVIRQTVQTEVKAVMREVIQEEMAAAARGLIRGMTDIGDIIKEEINEVMQEEFDWEVENVANEVAVEEPVMTTTSNFHKPGLDEAITDYFLLGHNPKVGKDFKSFNSRNNTLYQAFMKHHKGVRGAWANHVEYVLNK